MERISLQNMVGGALQEQFDEPEIQSDPDTGEVIEPSVATVIDMRKAKA